MQWTFYNATMQSIAMFITPPYVDWEAIQVLISFMRLVLELIHLLLFQMIYI